jgi:hypothetical protein
MYVGRDRASAFGRWVILRHTCSILLLEGKEPCKESRLGVEAYFERRQRVLVLSSQIVLLGQWHLSVAKENIEYDQDGVWMFGRLSSSHGDWMRWRKRERLIGYGSIGVYLERR